MTYSDVLLQQVINGLSLGAMYALLALGFTMVYGILELINFAHFNVFMVGAFFGMWVLNALGIVGQSTVLFGWPLAGALALAFIVSMTGCGVLGVLIERISLRPLRNVTGPAAMITTIGVSYILGNLILLGVGGDTKNYPNPLPVVRWHFTGGAEVDLRELLVWGVALVLMVSLQFLVRKTRIGKAMQATAQDAEAAQMMGVEVNRIVVFTFFIGSALAGAAGVIFGLYYNQCDFMIGYTAGLRAFTAAVLGGIGDIRGAMLGGIIIGLIQTLGGQLIAVAWTDVIIFSILVLVLVFRPTGLLGVSAPTKS
jgi:branched-chain amino acid transport system permease protein